MKVRHFNTVFSALLLAFVPVFVFASSTGTCTLTQSPTGEYTIVCEGDGVFVNYVDHTNEVYVIENCEVLKAQLLNAVDSIDNEIYYMFFYDDFPPSAYDDALSRIDSVISSLDSLGLSEDPDYSDIYQHLRVARQDLEFLKNQAVEVRQSLKGSSPSSLYSRIASIQCGSCSTNNGGGSCCDVDLTPILRELNDVNLSLSFITNRLSLIGPYIQTATSVRYARMDWSYSSDKYTFNKTSNLPTINNDKYRNVITLLQTIQTDLVQGISSLNNYMGYLTREQLPAISNDLDVVKSTTTNLYIASTNHFSFFRNLTFQDSPLIDYSQQSTFDNYYDFLTNHYIKVSFKQYNSLVGEEKAKTNWFSRVETLLAALVFNDSEGTNTVDDTYGESQQNNLINSLDGMNNTSVSQVNLMSSMGDNLLSSLRSLNSSFSSAVSMPSEVNLADIYHSNGMVTQHIKFQSSEISQLVEACRCATTLAWCFGGIWLLFLFVSWSIKTSYSLCVFCWSVVSAIFGGGKT